MDQQRAVEFHFRTFLETFKGRDRQPHEHYQLKGGFGVNCTQIKTGLRLKLKSVGNGSRFKFMVDMYYALPVLPSESILRV